MDEVSIREKEQMFELLTDPLKHSQLVELAELLMNDIEFQDDFLSYLEERL